MAMEMILDLEWGRDKNRQPNLRAEEGSNIYVVDRKAVCGGPGRWFCELGRVIGRTQQNGQIILVMPIRLADQDEVDPKVSVEEATVRLAQGNPAYEVKKPRKAKLAS